MAFMHGADELTPARLRAALAVASTGSFTAAARAIGTSQSNVSRSVAAVEATIGAPIFDRSTRSVRLTDVGREFVERAALVTAELDATVRALRPDDRPAPRLTIASLTSVSELHLAAAITSTPEFGGRLRCIEGLQAAVEHAVTTGRAAVGIGDLASVGDLIGEPLWREPFRLAVPTGHRFARRRRVGLDELAAEPLVSFSRDAELRTTVDRELAAARQLLTPDITVDRFRTACSFVAAGSGVMVIPAIVSGATGPGVRVVDLDHPDLHRTIGVFRRPGTDLPRPIEAVLGHLVDVVCAQPGVTPIADA